MTHALIFLGGDLPIPTAIPAADLVIAADGGLDLAHDLDIEANIVIGDFDSVTAPALDAARASGAEIITHPRAKDATDFALALDLARERGATRVTIAGGIGGRLDHLLGNALLLGLPEYRGITIEARFGPATLTVIHERTELVGAPGDLVSLFPIGGPAHGITTTGLRWNLSGETLMPGTSRGISNEFVDAGALVLLDRGTLLAIAPGGANPTGPDPKTHQP